MGDDRLSRTLRASGAPVRDPQFALLVLERTEAERYRRARLRALLHGGGVAAAAAAGLFLLGMWADANPGVAADGALSVAGLVAMAWLAHGFARRLNGAR